ncbi:MAG: hypothetical protein HY057_11975, partial [Rhodospirillales bacterium]|nr:hypothetical protein [Rhodospirillales bacterium]
VSIEREVDRLQAGPAIPAAKRAGWLGERLDGYLGLVAAEVPSEVRALIVLEILELPFDSWFSQAHPVLSAVSRVGRSMLLRININTTDFKDFVSLGAYGVGADLHETPGSETDMIGRIEKFAARAARSGLRSYLYGISSLSLATAAICSGFDYVAGDVIAGPVDNPGSVVMADKWSIYTRALKSEPAGA